MGKPWMAYLSSGLLLMAGVFMLIGQKPLAGTLVIIASLAGIGLQLYLKRNHNKGN